MTSRNRKPQGWRPLAGGMVLDWAARIASMEAVAGVFGVVAG